MVRLTLGHMATVSVRDDIFLTGVTDIDIRADPLGPLVYTTTRPGGGPVGGGVAAYRMQADGGLVRLGQVALPGQAVAGVSATLQTAVMGGDMTLVVTGVAGKGLWTALLRADGSIGSMTQGLLENLLPGKLGFVQQITSGGVEYFCGSYLGSGAITVWHESRNGTLFEQQVLPPGSSVGGRGVTAMATATLNGQSLLLAASDGASSGDSSGAAAVTSYRLDSQGHPVALARLGAEAGLWIADPSAIRVVSVGGQSHAVLAASTSSSLTVIRIDADGTLTPLDHVLDSLNTRFSGVTQLETIEIGGKAYVVAAGGDDGISLFQLLPGGRLLHLDTLADATDTTLDAVSALALTEKDGDLVVLVTSGSEAGITVLTADLGAAGTLLSGTGLADTLTGGAGSDVLAAGAGNDLLIAGAGGAILIDGAGADILRGGAGGDVFVLDADGVLDQIIGFDPSQDRIDLSGWRFLRNTDQLTITPTPTGAEISFRNEVLRITTQDNHRLDAAVLRAMALIDGDHLMPGWFSAEEIQLSASVDVPGTAAAETLSGTLGNNRIAALAGNDTLLGLAGDDTLDGGSGADLLNGGPGSDTYLIDDPGDRVAESNRWPGTDLVISAVSFRLGTAHVENLTLTGTAILGAGNGLINVITGNDSDNILDGGKNNDTLIGGLGNDTYLLRAPGDRAIELAGGGIDTVKAFRSTLLDDNVENLHIQTLRNAAGQGVAGVNGIGNALANSIVGNPYDNVLNGREGNDTLRGQGGADTFVFDRAPGPGNVDSILDFAPGADRIGLKGALFGLPAADFAAGALGFGSVASTAGQRILYDRSTGNLWSDRDGTGAAAPVLFATLSNLAPLTADDFLLY